MNFVLLLSDTTERKWEQRYLGEPAIYIWLQYLTV